MGCGWLWAWGTRPDRDGCRPWSVHATAYDAAKAIALLKRLKAKAIALLKRLKLQAQ